MIKLLRIVAAVVLSTAGAVLVVLLPDAPDALSTVGMAAYVILTASVYWGAVELWRGRR